MKKGKYIVINGVDKEILKEILFSKHLTEDEHSLLDDLIESRLNQLYERKPREEGDLWEEEQLEHLRFKITKWRG
tara:strand:- start:247 stop:471 length:225 start_codon:yes stop_codon:yes gene_type:complete